MANVAQVILNSVEAKIKGKNQKDFFKILFNDIEHYNLELFDETYLAKSAVVAYDFIMQYNAQGAKIEFIKAKGDEEYSIIQILNTDIPFLIDSLLNELKKQNIAFALMTHPMFDVVRDENGEFVKFSPDGIKESLLQFFIPNIEDAKQEKKLLASIELVLKCVNYAVMDWKKMTALMEETTKDINQLSHLKSAMKEESVGFLNWLKNGNFVFLGFAEYALKDGKMHLLEKKKLGVARGNTHKIDKDLYCDMANNSPISIAKWDERSLVHRSVHMDNILVEKFDDKGKVIGYVCFLGLFASSVYKQSIRNIPIVRNKINKVITKYGYPEDSFSCKELITALEQFPRAELLQMSEDELLQISSQIVSLSFVPKVKLFIRKSSAAKFLSCMIFIPENKFSTEVRVHIEDILCKKLNGLVSKRYVQIGESPITKLQVIIRTEEPVNLKKINVSEIEKEIAQAISGWSDDFYNSLVERFDKKEATLIFAKYKNTFDFKYRAVFSPNKAIHDIKLMDDAFSENTIKFDLYISSEGAASDHAQLKIYSPNKTLALSKILPTLENLGLFAEDMITYPIMNIGESKNLYIHHFRLCEKNSIMSLEDKALQNMLVDALDMIWKKEIEDDKFNNLIFACAIDALEANLVRALFKYLKQTNYSASLDFSIDTILAHAAITKEIVKLFNIKFDILAGFSLEKYEEQLHTIDRLMVSVTTSAEEAVFKNLLNLIHAIKRTNFYQIVGNNKKAYLSFKIASGELDCLPKPKPMAEIFVYSPRFEAVHLRGGKVARGGLRWSDRKEDFRTEVLGLMKAQMTKNSVIVPVGSKGGFVVKTANLSREDFMKEGVECYKMFLAGMLDITDNIIGTKIVHPEAVIMHDEPDPYLVVAADKGTATFSDYANQISQTYGFWLGDAFASGGSVGYDHKKMGITAKGAWISVERHFAEMGVDITQDEFTCVGIGDMAGDVFGNGMLLSKKMKLLAAFNHMHIFIDPTPNAAASFKERERMFNLPRSTWDDYNKKLISKGGGVFDRKSKSIKLSPEAKLALGISLDEMSPDALIKEILQAKVDLLWNGGIGTYIKASFETNDMIGDKANDALRVNGAQLKCKMVGEGGNLGCTQFGRIEYAKLGGRINTDFIDNSAGVDCSDHEVNIKIAMAQALHNGQLKLVDRNKLLEKMTDNVSDLVLNDNHKQTQILSIETLCEDNRINAHDWLMKKLESLGGLDRKIEFLPTGEEMQTMIKQNKRLTRPEVAVLLAYAKNSAFHTLLKSDVTKDKFLDKYLNGYFPNEFVKKMPEMIGAHKLKKEILGTVLVNDFINTVGCSFFHQVLDDTSASADEVIKAYVIVREVFGLDKIWLKIEGLSPSTPIEIKIKLFKKLQEVYERNITWILSHNKKLLKDLHASVDSISSNLNILIKDFNSVASKVMLDDMEKSLEKFATDKEALLIAREILRISALSVAFDIIQVSSRVDKKINLVAKKYFEVGDKLSFVWLLNQAKAFVPRQYFQLLALKVLINQIQSTHMDIVALELKEDAALKIDIHLAKSYNDFIMDLKAGNAVDVFISKLTIAFKKVQDIYIR